MCLELTIKTLERHHWRRSGVSVVDFENISHLFLVLLLVILNGKMFAVDCVAESFGKEIQNI